MIKIDIKKSLGFILIVSSCLFLSSTQAATLFLDDFEDGNHDGWTVTTSGAGRIWDQGRTGVEEHNGSNMAYASPYVWRRGGGLHSLSRSFDYSSEYFLSFTMHAEVDPNLGTIEGVNAGSGVTITFRDSLDVALGAVTFANVTDPSYLGVNGYDIGGTPIDYSEPMSEWASLAGVTEIGSIDSIDLDFWTFGDSVWRRRLGGSTAIWFDNVHIETIPIPAAVWLFGSGAMGLAGVARRKTA